MIVSVIMGGLLAGYMIAAGSLTSLLRSYGWLRQVAMLVLGPGG
jgi:hypothetical protein